MRATGEYGFKGCIYYGVDAPKLVGNPPKTLWQVEGHYSKPAAHRPFLTSRADCREWIEQQYAADAMMFGAVATTEAPNG